jgi:T5SS/PEP-CTERM-associated repeat protein
LYIGWNGTANLVVSNGAHISNSGTIWLSRNGTGSSNNTLTVTGAGSKLTTVSELFVGDASANNSVTISAGGVVISATGRLAAGSGVGDSNNTVVVTGPGSLWEMTNAASFLQIGASAPPGNSLIISNGGEVINMGTFTRMGTSATSGNNSLIVDGAGSTLIAGGTNTASGFTYIGNNGFSNVVIVKNGGFVHNNVLPLDIGAGAGASNCTLTVTGTNSLWIADGSVQVGLGDVGNQLTVSNGGEFRATGGVDVSPGGVAGGTVLVSGGTLDATNSVTNSYIRVGLAGSQGTFTFNSGTVNVDSLLLSNGAVSTFNFNGGVLNVKSSSVSNGVTFAVGDGTDAATLDLLAFSHKYANGLSVLSNATLTGVGTIVGNSTLANGATLAPGPASGVGTLTLANNLVVNNGVTLQYSLGTNSDLIAVSGNLTLGGTLNVSNAGGFGVGTYTLFTYAGSMVNNGLTIGTTPNAGLYYALDTSTAGQVNLDVSYTAPAGPITGSSTIALGASGVTYSISSVTDATTYTWSVPSGATIASGQGTTSITINFGCSAVSGNVTVTPSDTNGSGASSSLGVTVTAVGAAGAMTGSSSVNAGDSGDVYSISGVGGATTYTWTVPSGATIASGQGTTSITVNYSCSAVSGSVQVTPSNANGCTGGSSSLGVTVTSVGAAGAITGSSSVNAGDSGDVYSISSVGGATTYTWMVPSGATIASGQGTTSITVNYLCSAVSGSVQVTPSNANGCTGGSSSLGVTVTSVGAAGSISGSTAVCAGASGLAYSISSVSGATNYTWSVPSDATITSGQGSTSITVTWGSTSGSVSVTPANGNGCTGGAGNLSVTVNPLPATPTAANNGPIIEGNTLNLTASTVSNTTYSWTGPNGFASSSQNPSISNATSAASGTYLVTVTDSNGCTSAVGSTTALVTALQITSITTQGSDILITWAATGGTTNAVQATPGNPGYNTNFVDISGPLLILGSGDTSTNYVDSGAATNSPVKFYRVRLVP